MNYDFIKIEDAAKLIPDRIKDSHKGTYGRVALLGGAVEYSGAIRLSAMALAALKSGAGLSLVAVPRYLVSIVSQSILEVMIYPIDSTDKEIVFNKENVDDLLSKADVLACGMGLGRSEAAHKIVYYIIKNYSGRLVLDADALNILSENIDILSEVKCKIILTPHMMEFKRLYDAAFCISEIESCRGKHCESTVEHYEKNRLEFVKKFIEKYNVTLLLKGPTTIVASVGASANVGASFTSPHITFIDRGTPGMATAGSGDVLSGIIAGFLGYIENEYDATCVAAFVNGIAGELAAHDEGEISMIASDTVNHIANAIKLIKNINH